MQSALNVSMFLLGAVGVAGPGELGAVERDWAGRDERPHLAVQHAGLPRSRQKQRSGLVQSIQVPSRMQECQVGLI